MAQKTRNTLDAFEIDARNLVTSHLSHRYEYVYKRAFDLILSTMVLVFLWPIYLGLWIVVRLDGGPGLFSQERVGQDGKTFKCLKFRTMHVDAEQILQDICANDPKRAAEWHKNQKLKDDPRITRFGKILRETSLDELPQIWNVFVGEMSFVGPRPMLPSQENLYRSGGGGAGYYNFRPGITGPWQIDGRGDTAFLDRVRYDNMYLTKISLWNDLVILFRTVKVVFLRKGQ